VAAKKVATNALFPEADPAKYGEHRRHRRLFIPKQLEDAGRKLPMAAHLDPAKANAYDIIATWAELAKSGALAKKNEQTLKPEFLTQVFGQALGFKLLSEGKDSWNLEPEYSVNGGSADAAIGYFSAPGQEQVRALVEIKGPTANLDKDRVNGRTAVQQCWDYLNAVPECPWGIVSNFVSIRIYHRAHTPRVYELFVLEDLLNKDLFDQLYYILSHDGLLAPSVGVPSRIDSLLDKTTKRQREVGDELYDLYHAKRVALIHHLMEAPHNLDLEDALAVAQKLLDRILFIAFCEDRDLLPPETIKRAHESIPPFSQTTNPRWRNFLDLFRSVDVGHDPSGIPPFDGGLFRHDDRLDSLQLDNEWTDFFVAIAGYNFRDEVSVEVLGHLFERSIRDIESIRLGGLFGTEIEQTSLGAMAKSAERKRQGIYYTPVELTNLIVTRTVGEVADRAISRAEKASGLELSKDAPAEGATFEEFAEHAVSALREIDVIDPACGSGAFLIQAYDALEERYQLVIDMVAQVDVEKAREIESQVPRFILQDNLHGVDLSPEAIEIAQLSLWIRSARRDRQLDDLSANLVCGNSVVSDAAVDERALDWEKVFDSILGSGGKGFDCVIGNPPWERVKLQDREFFSDVVPEVAAAVNAAERKRLIAKLEKEDPALWQRYLDARDAAESVSTYARESGRFPKTSKGDINYYALFAELATTLVSADGAVGMLVPSGIATDKTTSAFFSDIMSTGRLVALYDFENRKGIFPDVDGRMKFSVFHVSGSGKPGRETDFVFFAHTVQELGEKRRHVALSSKDIALMNPNTGTCPIFRSDADADLTRAIYKRVPVFVRSSGSDAVNPWGVQFSTMFHQTNDAGKFRTAEYLKSHGFALEGMTWKKGKRLFLPVYEAKMVQAYDHRAASVVVKEGNWMRQGQKEETSLVEHMDPSFSAVPRWWVNQEDVLERMKGVEHPAFLGFKDITSPTNQRTMIASAIPWSGVTNHFPLVLTDRSLKHELCLLANLNSLVLDYVCRQKIGGVTLNFFIVEQLPILAPEAYDIACPWDKEKSLLDWISERVLNLTYTSNDLTPLASSLGCKQPTKWDDSKRLDAVCELDAAFFILYGLTQPEVEYVIEQFPYVLLPQERLLSPETIRSRILKLYAQMRAAAVDS